MRNLRTPLAVLAAAALSGAGSHGQTTLFSDNFDMDTSANWNVVDGSLTVSDYKALFAFDYTTNKVVINGVTNTIPAAPNGGGKGVRLEVNNNDENTEIAAVSLYPKNQTFSGDYAVRFDMWINYNGPAYGGLGSTEFATFGVNHAGDKANWAHSSVVTASDGVWFAVSGEGGAAGDYRAYVGDGFSPALQNTGLLGGFLDRDGDGTYEEEVAGEPETYPLKQMFGAPSFESPGAPGKRWVQVEVRQRNTDIGPVVTWLMDGYVIAENSLGSQFGMNSGNVMLGMMDVFPSIADPRADNFIIYDNVRVVSLTGVPELPVVSITANDAAAAEPSDTASVTIARTGSTAEPLTINYRFQGTAAAGVDYSTNNLPGAVVLAAGQASTNLVITPINDTRGEATETIFVTISSGAGYEIRNNLSARIELADDTDVPSATLSLFRPAAYEGNTNLPAQVRVNFSSTMINDVTVNFATSGDAVSGTHYLPVGTSVVVPAGQTNATISIVALNNADTVSNRTATVTLAAGTGYTLATSNTVATVTIFNDDLPAGKEVLFTDNFETDTSANWAVNLAHPHNRATFNWDYSMVGIPPAPNSGGTTHGLKLEANVPDLGIGLFSGLSVSPLNFGVEGDFRLRFDWWPNAPGPMPGGGTGSTQMSTYGITRGDIPQWPGSVSTTDAVYFAWTGEAGSSVDVRVYTNAGAPVAIATPGVYAAGTSGSADAGHPYYAVFGRVTPPEQQSWTYPSQTGFTAQGAPAFSWHDVVITKIGFTVTWTVDGVLMASIDASNLTLSTNFFLGQSDINNGQASLPEMLFGLFDNVRVERLEAAVVVTPAEVAGITVSGGNATIQFSGAANTQPSNYKVVQSATVDGTYTVNNAAVITSLGGNSFQAVVPTSGGSMFYRIQTQ